MAIISALPFTLQNGTTADATQVMADFDGIVDDVNNNAAHNGANNDITSFSGLTTPITPAQGGTTAFIGGTSGGAANVQTLANPTPNGFALTVGYRVTFIAGFTNTAAMTLNVNTLGAKNVFRSTPAGPQAMTGGEIVAGNEVEVIYDGTQFQLFTVQAQFGGTGVPTVIASATTTDLGTVASHYAVMTLGATPVTSFGSSASTTYPIYFISFSGGITLTYNAVSLILPGQISITTVAGDFAIAVYAGAGNWTIISYQRRNGTPLNFNAAFLQGYINGLTLSTAGGSGTMGIAAGIAADSTNASMMALNSAYTKTTASWAVGTGNGGLDTGAIANSTQYHWFEIQRPDTGVVDVLFSLSPTAPTMPTNYTLFRRIGSMKTNGSAQWVTFTQTGDQFILSAAVADTGTAGTARSNLTLAGAPTGVVVTALGRPSTSAGGINYVLFTSLLESDQSPGITLNDLSQQATGQGASANIARLTNTSAQIGMRANAAGIGITFNTYGWVDTRGKS